jgi:hypothetical protein
MKISHDAQLILLGVGISFVPGLITFGSKYLLGIVAFKKQYDYKLHKAKEINWGISDSASIDEIQKYIEEAKIELREELLIVTHKQIRGKLSLYSGTWKYGDDGELNKLEDDCLKIRHVETLLLSYKKAILKRAAITGFFCWLFVMLFYLIFVLDMQ